MRPRLLARLTTHPSFQRAKALSATVYEELFRTRAFTMAAAMSYYALLALLPLLIFLSAMLGYLPIPNLFDQLLDILAVVVPPEAMQMVERILASLRTPHRGGLLSFGLLSYLWTASGGFAASIEALNVAYDVEKGRGWWRDRLQALLLTFTTGGLMLLGLLMIIAGPHFGNLLTELFPVPQRFGEVWPVLRLGTIFVIFVAAVELQYWLAPNRKQHFMDTLPGSLVAVAGIFLCSGGLGYYFAHFANYNKTYGSLGAVIILMLWFYVVALLFIVGAELNAELLKLETAHEEPATTSQMPAKVKGAPAA
ncbi:MAG TPA: YihY/virulence factor BrkB family protein [Acidobacteriaceae bacterium]|jgi:membrane protein|nr:YihY/virulence factor BrkB family protein [Acidobacteriaceae bacterium]